MWATQNYYRVLGNTFAVRASVDAVGNAIDDLLVRFRTARSAAPGRRTYSLASPDGELRAEPTLYRECRPVHRGAWTHLIDALLADLNQQAVEAFTGFAVHAGVVASAGRTIAFPAGSGEGKSTLTAGCVAAGFDYVSDEALCVRFSDASVIPYAKPLMLSAWSRAAVGVGATGCGIDNGDGDRERPVPAERLGGRAVAENERLALTDVVELVRADGAPRLLERPRAEAMTTLLRMSFNHYKRPRQAFDLASALARDARMWRLEYAAPVAAAELLMERLGTS